jgi:hypothetical protein
MGRGHNRSALGHGAVVGGSSVRHGGAWRTATLLDRREGGGPAGWSSQEAKAHRLARLLGQHVEMGWTGRWAGSAPRAEWAESKGNRFSIF